MNVLRRLAGYVRPYLGRLVAATLMLVLSGALMGAVVSTVKPLVNNVLLGQVEEAASETAAEAGPDILREVRDWFPRERIARWTREHAFVEVPLLLVLIYLIRSTLGYFGQFFLIRTGCCVIRDLRLNLYRAVAYQSPGFFREHPTGVILSRILNDVQVVRHVVTTSLAHGVRVAAMVPILLAVAFLHEWRMSLLVTVALPLLGWPMVRLGRKLRSASTLSQQKMAEVAHKVSESVSGVRVVQSFGMEPYEIGRFERSVHGVLRAELRAGRATSLAPALIELFGAMVGAALFYVAGRGIAARALDPGDLGVVMVCLGVLFASTRRLNALYAEIQRALAAAVRVFDMLDREREIRDLPGARELPPFGESIRFEGVDFSYGDENVLEGVDLAIRKGEVVALVGPSGAGKSTLANLLPRFFDATRGRVLIDGHDVREVTLSSLRGQIGIVTQETVLFDDTVRNNIAYGREDCPLERVIEVARATQAHEFINRLPEGYDTVIGEGGDRLSMGQRQRLTIARALLKDPPVLILDEATSALDAKSEALVQQALEVLKRGRTSLVIAHRLATIRRADRIVVIDEGRIVEVGSHRELLAREGVYARLHALQFRGEAVG
jgi:subfamily B ATP-binding cassette protein MsbA